MNLCSDRGPQVHGFSRSVIHLMNDCLPYQSTHPPRLHRSFHQQVEWQLGGQSEWEMELCAPELKPEPGWEVGCLVAGKGSHLEDVVQRQNRSRSP